MDRDKQKVNDGFKILMSTSTKVAKAKGEIEFEGNF